MEKELDHIYSFSFQVAPRGNGVNYGTQFNLMDPMMETAEAYNHQQVLQKYMEQRKTKP